MYVISVDPNYIVVISETQSIPVLIAERLLKFGYQMIQVRTSADVLNLPDGSDMLKIAIVEVTPKSDENELLDLIEAIQVVEPSVLFFFAAHADTEISSELRSAAGRAEVISYPYEEDVLISKTLELAPVDIPRELLTLDAVAPVQLPLLKEFDILPFDVFIFLPLNQRAILYKKGGQSGFYADLSRIADVKQSAIYIRRTDFPVYSKYVAKYVSEFESLDTLPDSVRAEVTRQRFTEIIRGFIGGNFAGGEQGAQEALASARKVTLEFVRASSADPVWQDRIRSLIGRELTNYNHALNVSAYCVMFGLMAGLDDVDSLALGGMFHDIGMSALPPEIANKDFELMTSEEIMVWEEHPEIGIEMIEKKGISLNYEVEEMIREHHNVGTGERVVGSRAFQYAQICAFADVFDELTSVRPAKRQLTATEAVKTIAGFYGPASSCYDEKFHRPIVDELLGDKSPLLEGGLPNMDDEVKS